MESGTTSPVIVARVVKPHGIRGEVVLESYTDVEGRLENTQKFLLIRGGVTLREIEVDTRRYFDGRHVIKFSGVSSRNDAELLRGLELGVPESEVGDLPPDHFFVHDLVGMLVVVMKDGTEVGKVTGVMKTGGVDLLEVGDILIPFVEQICVEVDREGGIIRIDPPEGLLQLNAR